MARVRVQAVWCVLVVLLSATMSRAQFGGVSINCNTCQLLIDWGNLAGANLACSVAKLPASLPKDVCVGVLGQYLPVISELKSMMGGCATPSAGCGSKICEAIGACGPSRPVYTGVPYSGVKHYRELAGLSGNTPIPPLPPMTVPALSNNPNVGSFIVVADMHVDFQYAARTEAACAYPTCCRAGLSSGTPVRPAGAFGDIPTPGTPNGHCDTSPATWAATAQAVAALNPDFVLNLGDAQPHDVWAQSTAEVTTSLSSVASTLHAAVGDKTPVLAILGNHDTYALNQLRNARKDHWLFQAAADAWAPWLSADAQKELAENGYYSQVVLPGLRIVAMEAQWGSADNFYMIPQGLDNAASGDRGFQLAWLKAVLQKASDAGESVYVLFHIPTTGQVLDSYADALHALLEQYSGVVRAVFHGDTHRDHFSVMFDRDTATRALLTAHIVPAVQNTFPRFRQYFYDRRSFALLDYVDHRASIEEANQKGQLFYSPYYSARAEYGLPDLSAASYHNLLYRLARNSSLLDRYLDNLENGLTPASSYSALARRSQICRAASFSSFANTRCNDDLAHGTVQHVCGYAAENENATVTCPAGLTIQEILFASYGTPVGTCGAYEMGACHSSASEGTVWSACGGKSECSVLATNAVFDARGQWDPCFGTIKALAVDVACA